MNVSHSFDESGTMLERVELSEEEARAIGKAHEIAVERCAAAGVGYGEKQKEWMYWCLMGALRIGGIDEMMRYVREAKICGEKKTARAGYSDEEEAEDLQ
jgi:hypothetical protein